MSKKEYMEILLSQIRNDKAKELVGEEIGAHIDDQTEVYMEFGIDLDTAEEKAVRSMGDPVETGVSLDRIHKPKMSWTMILLVAILSVIGLVIQGLSWAQTGEMFFFHRQIAFVALGFVCMLVICFIDYSFFVQRGRILAGIYLIITILFLTYGTHTNGSLWLHFGGISFSWHFIMYLSIPIFGILLYLYRKQLKRHLLVPVGFMVFVLLVFWKIGPSRLVFVNLLFMALILLTYALAKKWYPVNVKVVLSTLWGCFTGCLALCGGLLIIAIRQGRYFLFHGYVLDRISYFVQDGEKKIDLSYVDATSLLSDYLLTYIMASYGILLLLVIVTLFAFFCYKIFHMTMQQKNQAGTIIGIGCGLIFVVQIGEYVLMNLGLIPGTTVFLPLFSYGGSGTVVSFALIGLLLSIYRYQNLVTEQRKKKRLVVEWKEV